MVIPTVPEPDVTVAPVSDGSTIPYAGVEYGLMCGVDSNESYVGMMGAEVVIVWRNSEGDPVISDARVSVSQTEAVPGEGGFRSTLTFSPLSLSDTGDYVCSAVYTPDPSWSFVTPSSPGEDTYTVNVTGRTAHAFESLVQCLLLLFLSSPTSKPNSVYQWFWGCRRTTGDSVRLSVHPGPRHTTISRGIRPSQCTARGRTRNVFRGGYCECFSPAGSTPDVTCWDLHLRLHLQHL